MRRSAPTAGPEAGDGPILPRLAAEMAGWTLEALPGDVVAKARICVLDALAGCFAVPADRRNVAARATATALPAASGSATILGRPGAVPPADAAFANAVASAAAETNDTHAPTATHPGITIVPAVLAAAEAEGRDGRAAIEGIVAGYEVMGRLAGALITPEVVKTYRSSGLTGPTAAALATARALGLPASTIAHAAALATHTAGGFNEWAHAGTDEHVFHIGFAARNGVLAALLARAGATAAPTILDGRSGLLAAFGATERAPLLAGRAGAFEIMQVVHKPAPACFFVQTPCQAAEALVTAGAPKPDDIATIEVHVSRAAAEFPGCNHPGPMLTRQNASMSIQFSVASVLVRRGIRHAGWEDYRDASANRLAGRTSLIVDEELTRAYPGRSGAVVTVRDRDGRERSAGADDFRSMTADEVMRRFVEAASPHVGEGNAEAAVDLVGRFETLADVGRLTALLRPAAEDRRG